VSQRWTIQDLEKLAKKGLNVEGVSAPLPPKPKIKVPAKEPAAIGHIKGILTLLNIPFVQEHRFHPTRKFRFDIAIIEPKIAIEYEGLLNVEKSGHTTPDGYTNNCRKYNLAIGQGWRVLRYTALNYMEFYSELEQIIKL